MSKFKKYFYGDVFSKRLLFNSNLNFVWVKQYIKPTSTDYMFPKVVTSSPILCVSYKFIVSSTTAIPLFSSKLA